ncbi:hypothetical protein B0919_15145 [Hymenobacter sp. CRA2]|nr:hypothetical protein B0919_15145 [Hymenobacter sp. CRA2]
MAAGPARAQAPVLTSRNPARNATSAARTGPVTASFTQAITAASGSAMRVYGNQLRGLRPGSYAAGSTLLSFTPTQSFAPGELISVTLPNALQGAGGGISKQVYQFTAAAGGSGRGFFADTTSVPLVGTSGMAVGDVDNDGDLDLVSASDFFSAGVRFNNGSGAFPTVRTVLAGGEPSGLTLGDVDNDGDLDLVVTDAPNNGGTGYANVCYNDGAGNFAGFISGAQLVPVGTNPVGVALGDIDADGDLDIVTANQGSNSASIRLNNGTGVFGGTGSVAVGTAPRKLLLADVNNDGSLDLLTLTGNTVSLRLNNGSGSFSNAGSVSVGNTPEDLAVADIDGDGDLDLATANAGGSTLSLRLNNGTGTFSGTTELTVGTGPGAVAFGDMDADGDLDLLATILNGTTVLLQNNGRGTFASVAGALTAAGPFGLALADVDNDGDLDVVAASGNGTASIALNQASVPLAITGLSPASGLIGTSVTVTGTNLVGTTSVSFNGTPAPSFVLNSPRQLTVTVPPGTTTGPVTVTTPLGTATSVTSFTVLIPIAISGVQPARNTAAVSRTGSVTVNFSEPIAGTTADQLRVYGNRLQGLRAGTRTGGGTSSLSFTPTLPYAPGEAVSVSITSGLRGPGGNPVLPPQLLQFTAAVGGTGQGNFSSGASVPVGYDSRSVAAGDVNGDGSVDLVTADYASQAVSIRLNNGSGSFSGSAAVALGTAPQYVALGDVDGDSDLDLVASSPNGTISIRLNNGSGTFSGTASVAGSGRFGAPVLADIDADGDLDLLAVDQYYGGVAVYFNSLGSFSAASTGLLTVGAGIADLALGDVDNDGDLDLAVAGGTGTNAVYLRYNDGRGAFSGASSIATAGQQPTKVRLADLDGDGDLDLLTADAASNALSVLLNSGNGSAFAAPVTLAVGAQPRSLQVGDLDADGDPDVVVVSSATPATASLLFNAGNGSFEPAATVRLSAVAEDLALADVSGDGDLDLLTANGTSNTVSVFENASFAPAISAFTPSSGPAGTGVLLTGFNLQHVASVRFNGAPATEFVATSPTQLAVTVPAGASTGPISLTSRYGTSTSATSFTVLPAVAIVTLAPGRNSLTAPVGGAVTATFTQPITAATASGLVAFGSQHGRLAGGYSGGGTTAVSFAPTRPFAPGERVSVTVPGTLRSATGAVAKQVYQFAAAVTGPGRGVYTSLGQAQVQAGPRSIATGDLDGDGDLDMAVVNANSHSVSIRFNDGTGVFAGIVNLTTLLNPAAVVLADMDADGDLDLLVAHYGSGSIATNSLLLSRNNGRGVFGAPVVTALSSNPRDLAVGDMDADGDLDVVTANYDSNQATVCFNDGSGTLTPAALIAVGSQPTAVELGDVDNDGDLDLLSANAGSNNVSVRLNIGSGYFLAGPDVPVGATPADLAVADVNGDGSVDIVTANAGNTASVSLNGGSGAFGPAGTVPLAGPAKVLVVADIDSDGDLDLLVSHSGTDNVSLRFNNGSGAFGGTAALPTGLGTEALAAADLDGDADLDLLTSARDTNSVRGDVISLWLNQRIAPPTITALAPASGLVGSAVLIKGSDLIGATAVSFNGVPATSFEVNSATQVTAVVPAGASTGVVTLTNAAGMASSPAPFTVLVPVAVTALSPARNATAAPGTGPVTATFAQPITAASAAGMSIFSSQRVGYRSAAPSGGSTTLSVTPTPGFAPDEQVSVTLPASLHSSTGGVAKQVYQFKAAAAGTGRGYYTRATTLPLYSFVYIVRLADVDADGDLDMLVGHNEMNRVEILRNDGHGAFTPSDTVRVSSLQDFSNALSNNHTALTVADIDHDGDLDLLASFSVNSSVAIRRNDGRGHFTGRDSLIVADFPMNITTGDVDADGDLDLVTANGAIIRGGSNSSTYLNDGLGHFSPHRTAPLAVSSNPRSMSEAQLADIDNDGDLDLILIDTTRPAVWTFRNDGQANFSNPASLPTGYSPYHVALGDIDADGDVDMVVTNGHFNTTDPGTISIRVNDGQGNYSVATDLPVAGYPYSSSLSDIDADGDLDLLVVDSANNAVEVHFNDGRGTFTPAPLRFAIGRGSIDMATGDLDGDGDVDFVTADRGANSVGIVFNEAAPVPAVTSFTPALGPVGTSVVITGRNFTGATQVKFNNTAAASFTVNSATQITATVPAGATTGPISVVLPTGSAASAASFTVTQPTAITSVTPAANANSVARNSAVTIVFAQAIEPATANRVRMFSAQVRGARPYLATINNRTLSLPPAQPFVAGEQISVVVPATVQTTSGNAVGKRVYQFTAATGGTGQGEFAAGGSWTGGPSAQSVQLGDLDNDGDLDMLAGRYGAVDVWLNNGRGQFTAAAPIMQMNSQSTAVALGDIDADGDLDVLTVDAGGTYVISYLNYGSAAFSQGYFWYIGSGANALTLGDVDADGDLDWVASNFTTGRLTVQLNDGLGSFSNGSTVTVGSAPSAVVLGDVDADGDLDLVAANRNSNSVSVRLNDGAGAFSGTTELSVGGSATSVALADVNGDRNLDLAVSYTAGGVGALATYLNNGSGVFATARTVAVGAGAGHIRLADVDADGDLDALTLNGTGNSLSVRLNDGLGSFSGSTDAPTSTGPGALALGDVDGDNDLDLMVAHPGSAAGSEIKLLLNQPRTVSAAASGQALQAATVHPNPARQQFVVTLPAVAGAREARLTLYNALGQAVRTQVAPLPTTAATAVPVAASQLPPGVYTVRIEVAGAPPLTRQVILQ